MASITKKKKKSSSYLYGAWGVRNIRLHFMCLLTRLLTSWHYCLINYLYPSLSSSALNLEVSGPLHHDSQDLASPHYYWKFPFCFVADQIHASIFACSSALHYCFCWSISISPWYVPEIFQLVLLDVLGVVNGSFCTAAIHSHLSSFLLLCLQCISATQHLKGLWWLHICCLEDPALTVIPNNRSNWQWLHQLDLYEQVSNLLFSLRITFNLTSAEYGIAKLIQMSPCSDIAIFMQNEVRIIPIFPSFCQDSF